MKKSKQLDVLKKIFVKIKKEEVKNLKKNNREIIKRKKKMEQGFRISKKISIKIYYALPKKLVKDEGSTPIIL